MARAANKTVRFTQIVERSGRPRVHTLWVQPEKDAEFKRAREGQRLMTIQSGLISGKADAGFVGFDAAHREGGQFLIFPKSLKRFDGARVVGIKFDLIEQPPLAAVRKVKHTTPPRKTSRRKGAFRLPPRETPKSEAKAKAERRNQRDNTATVPSAEKAGQRIKASLQQGGATPAKAAPPERSPEHAALIRQVRAALKDLQHDKPMTAYQRLEQALAAEG